MTDNPLVAQAHSSTTWYTGLGLAEDAAQISSGIQDGSWVDGTLGGVGGTLDLLGTVVDPLGSLVAWGVGWLMEHVRPLKQGLDWLAGQPGEIAAHAATWRNVAAATTATQQRYADTVRSHTDGWSGASGDAYRNHAGQQADALGGIAKASEAISYAVEGAGLLVGLVRGIVRDLIAQFVATLAARLPMWLAEAGLTLGIGAPVVIGQVAALVAKWVNRIQGFIRALLNSLRRLSGKLNELTGVLDGLKAALRKLSRSDPTATTPDTTSAVRQTGGELRRPRGDIDFEDEWADRAYDSFRASDDELSAVAATAREYGFTAEDITTIKNHVFRDEHLLDLYGDSTVARFDANPRMAEAWQRLAGGNPHPADIDLLRHERFESNYMASTGDPSYGRAHTATNDAGFTWDPEAAARDGVGYQRKD
ncbi:WXG100 family type VII secretion target [Paractinoplanes maris]|uniref:WXG100 family type VII secretion target n=1 Tax=Paractinoplanes maris TaxID=1734446 RepID=UPI002020449B|nr:WXG100 family type VII secretion target [Actinoplanes maris]